MDMRNEIRHEALGLLIEEELRRAGVNIAAMCDEMHMGHTTYSDLRGASINIWSITKVSLIFIVTLLPMKRFLKK